MDVKLFEEVLGFSQPPASSLWSATSTMKAALLLSIGHMLNERKHTHRSPLALREAWGVWDPKEGAPREMKLVLFWGPRPNDNPNRTSAYVPYGDERKLWIQKSNKYWTTVLNGENSKSPLPFPYPPAFIQTMKGRAVLIYKDTRCPIFENLNSIQASLWKMRRETLKNAPHEAASFFSSLGAVLAMSAKQSADDSFMFSKLKEAEGFGEELGKVALDAAFWLHDPERSNLDYDFACREAGQTANDYKTYQEAAAFFSSYFTTLASHHQWHKLAQGGEQEVFFPILCRLESKWLPRLRHADMVLGVGLGSP